MQLNIKTLTGRVASFNFEPDNTISQIKMALQEKEGIPVEQMRLVFGGKQLADEKTIKDYSIEPGSTMLMVLQLRGERKPTNVGEPINMKSTVLFPMVQSQPFENVCNSIFMQNSILLDWKGENLNVSSKTDIFDVISQRFSAIYNYDNVVFNRPLALEVKEELHRGKHDNQEFERLSEKHLSYFNLVSISTSLEKLPNLTHKQNTYKYNISKIYKNKNTGNELVIYNSMKNNWKTILLDSFRYMKQPCKHHAFGTKSGYYFIYDNQGIIHVIFENVQICELNLPDQRIDPTLFVYEKNIDQSILFVAGGYSSRNNGVIILDTVAVFYLNFKEISKLIKHEPLFYIKMKFPRFNPTIFKIKENNDLFFFFLGGNDFDKLMNLSKEGNKKKSMQYLFDEGNLFCETVSFKRIKDYIFKSDFTHTITTTTEDSLMVLLNSQNQQSNIEKSERKQEKIRFSFSEGAIIKMKLKSHRNKVPYLFGVGLKKNEIWLVDKINFIEHKMVLLKSRYKLSENKNSAFCKSMITLMGNDIYYFNKEEKEGMKFKKMHFKGDFSPKGATTCGKSECRLF